MREDDLADVWARSLADLADMQIEPHQRAWLQLTRPLGLVENTALIAAPNEFVKEQLETRLRALITNALSRELAAQHPARRDRRPGRDGGRAVGRRRRPSPDGDAGPRPDGRPVADAGMPDRRPRTGTGGPGHRAG